MLFYVLPKNLLVNYLLIRLTTNSLLKLSQTNGFFHEIIYNNVAEKIHKILTTKYGCKPFGHSVEKSELRKFCEICQRVDPDWYKRHEKNHNITMVYRNCSICESPLQFSFIEISQFISAYGRGYRIGEWYPTPYTKKDYHRIPNSMYFTSPIKAIEYYQEKQKTCKDCNCIIKHNNNIEYDYHGYSELCGECEQRKMSYKEPPVVNTIEHFPSGGQYNHMYFCHYCALVKTVTLNNLHIAQTKYSNYIKP